MGDEDLRSARSERLRGDCCGRQGIRGRGVLRAPAPGRWLCRRPSARSRRGQRQKPPGGNMAPFANAPSRLRGRLGPLLRTPRAVGAPLDVSANAPQGRPRSREDVKDGTPAGGPVLWGGVGLPPLIGQSLPTRWCPHRGDGWRAKVACLHRDGITSVSGTLSPRRPAHARVRPRPTEWSRGREAAGVPRRDARCPRLSSLGTVSASRARRRFAGRAVEGCRSSTAR